MKEEVELRKLQQPNNTHSLQVVVPMRFAKVLELEKHDYVKMTLRNHTIILEKYKFKE